MSKFPSHQKVHISKWGFTEFNADQSERVVVEKWLIPDGIESNTAPFSSPRQTEDLVHLKVSTVLESSHTPPNMFSNSSHIKSANTKSSIKSRCVTHWWSQNLRGEAGEPGVRDHPQLHSKFEVSLV